MGSEGGRHFNRDHADLVPRERRRYEHPQITDNRTLREALPAAAESKGQNR